MSTTPRALLVEREDALRKEIAEALRGADVSVEFAKDGPEALKRVQDYSPDIILLDVRMPGGGGRELVAQLKHTRPGIALVALTGEATVRDGQLGELDAVPVEPFDEKRLKEVIKRALWIHKAEHVHLAGEPWGRYSPAAHVVRDLHEPETGRLHARRIADYLAVPLSSLAAPLQVKVATLHKTPASPSLQEKLAPIAWIVGVLFLIFRSREGLLAWLNSPHPDLGGKAPLSFILGGKPTTISEMLEATLAGQPS